MQKRCTKCKQSKILAEFGTHRGKPHAQSWCRACMREYIREHSKKRRKDDDPKKHSAYQKSWSKRNPQKRSEIVKRSQRLKKYGLSEEGYQVLVKSQKGKCAICRKKNPLYIDHDHKTLKVRGLLCHKCNLGIGLLGDNKAGVKKALAYFGQ